MKAVSKYEYPIRPAYSWHKHGDPAGIGPEIVIKSLADPEILNLCTPVVLGDFKILKQADLNYKILQKLAITDDLISDSSNFPKGFFAPTFQPEP